MRPSVQLVIVVVCSAAPAGAFAPMVFARPPLGHGAAPRAVLRLDLLTSSPSQTDSEALGIRDWPSQAHDVPWTDECDDGALRYVLEGVGTVTTGGGTTAESIAVAPGMLLTSTFACTLSWVPGGEGEMVILTPEYRGPPLALVAGGLFGAFALLIAATVAGGGS